MGLCAKMWNYLCSAVVPQVINPKRANAQNWSHPFPISFNLFSGQIRSTYKILSKSVEKPKSYGMILFASFAPEDKYEKDKVGNSRFLKKICFNHILIVLVMPHGIFWRIIPILIDYGKIAEIFIIWNIFTKQEDGRTNSTIK